MTSLEPLTIYNNVAQIGLGTNFMFKGQKKKSKIKTALCLGKHFLVPKSVEEIIKGKGEQI